MTHKWSSWDHFWPFFGQLHENISQNRGSDGHFEMLMPYLCSHFFFDIKFGDRFYSKEKRRAWPVLF